MKKEALKRHVDLLLVDSGLLLDCVLVSSGEQPPTLFRGYSRRYCVDRWWPSWFSGRYGGMFVAGDGFSGPAPFITFDEKSHLGKPPRCSFFLQPRDFRI